MGVSFRSDDGEGVIAAGAPRSSAMKTGPTDSEYANFDGMHCSDLWRTLSNDWRCHSCRRSKRELMRWGTREGSHARLYGPVGWKIGLHRHHDYGKRWSG